MKITHKLAFLLVFLSFPAFLFSRSPKKKAELDTDKILEKKDALEKVLKYGTHKQRKSAMYDLAKFPPEHSEDLYKILGKIIEEDRDKGVKITAIRILAKLNRNEYAPSIIEALQDTSLDVKEAAITAIQKLHVEDATDELITLLKEQDFTRNQKISNLLINTLGMLENGKTAFPYLETKFKDNTTNTEIKATIALYFGKIKITKAENCLIDAINDDSQSNTVRSYALSSLGKIRSQKALPHVRSILEKAQNPKNKYEKQKYAPLKLYAMSALVAIGDKKILEDLIAYAKDDNPKIRIQAIRQLGDLHDKSVLELLQYKAKRDPNRRVRLTAKKVLEKFHQNKPKPSGSQLKHNSTPIGKIHIDEDDTKQPQKKVIPKSELIHSFDSTESVGSE
ncbi:MAG: HEAT repeat domain-containing protein [Spirochaetota bacterium]